MEEGGRWEDQNFQQLKKVQRLDEEEEEEEEELSEMWSKMYFGLHVKYRLFLSDFNVIFFSGHIFEKSSNIKFLEAPSSGSWVLWGRTVDRQTERWTDISKLFVAFRNFANASKKQFGNINNGVHYNSNGTTTTTDFNSLYRLLSSGMWCRVLARGLIWTENMSAIM